MDGTRRSFLKAAVTAAGAAATPALAQARQDREPSRAMRAPGHPFDFTPFKSLESLLVEKVRSIAQLSMR